MSIVNGRACLRLDRDRLQEVSRGHCVGSSNVCRVCVKAMNLNCRVMNLNISYFFPAMRQRVTGSDIIDLHTLTTVYISKRKPNVRFYENHI